MESAPDRVREVEIGGKKLQLYESHDTCDPATGRALTGSWLWESSLHLAEWMAAEGGGRAQLDLARRTLLELGAGTGLPGMAAAAVLGAGRVVLTDVAPLLPVLRRNVEVNGLEDRVEVEELVWGLDELGFLQGRYGEVDVVLLSDVFYDASEMPGLARTLRRVCGPETRIWASSEVRVGVEDCLEALMADEFGVVELPGKTRSLLRSPEKSAEFKIFLISPPAAGSGNGNLWSAENG